MSEMSIREMCVAGAVIMENEVVALQSQLGQAREALLLAQADLEAVLTELRTYFTARTYGERGDARVQLKVLAREAHPGAALADEVAAARAEHWTCASCGAEFPHIPGDADVQCCTKCVEVDVLNLQIERMISTHDMQMAESEHRGAAARNDRNIMRQALDEIDKHVVGAYEVAHSDMPEPCEECGEMREIAAHALALVKRGLSR